MFNNLVADSYWANNEFYDGTSWNFFFSYGGQHANGQTYEFYAWAVRDGDVLPMSAVPVPATAWLFGSGLLSLVGLARRKSA